MGGDYGAGGPGVVGLRGARGGGGAWDGETGRGVSLSATSNAPPAPATKTKCAKARDRKRKMCAAISVPARPAVLNEIGLLVDSAHSHVVFGRSSCVTPPFVIADRFIGSLSTAGHV